MINRIKAHFHVYAGHWELAFIILALVLGGVTTGYVLRGSQMSAAITGIQSAHILEIERIQKSNRETLAVLAGRLGEVAEQQSKTALEVGKAAETAKGAATTAKGAAINAAKGSIRIREIPAGAEPDAEPAPVFDEFIEP